MSVRGSGTPARRAGKLPPQAWTGVLDNVMLLASVSALLSLAYLLFIVLSGALAATVIAGTALDQVARNVNLAKGFFLWSLWVVVIAVMVRHYRSDSMGFVTLVVGGACWVMLPLVVGGHVPETSAYPLMEVAQSLVSSFRVSGGAMMMAGFLRVVVGRVIVLASPGTAGAQVLRVGADAAQALPTETCEHPSLMRRCWELHFCRESLRRHCPRFLEGVSCWRKRSGCYCDQGLATRLLAGTGGQSRIDVAEEMRVVRSPAWQYEEARRRKKHQAKKNPCRECPLYLEHQKYKYRAFSWLSYPTAAAVIAFSAAYIRTGYEWVDFRLGSLLAQFQVLPHPLTDKPLEGAPWLNAENAIVLIVGVLVVGLILQLAEVAIFRLKW